MITQLLDILFPKECISSGKKGEFLSKEEQRKLYTHPECCPGCKKDSHGFLYCHECSQVGFLKGCVIGFLYKGAIKKLLLQLKYNHRYGVTKYLSERLALHILAQPILANKIDQKELVVSSIPSHRRRKYFIKGYNQSELLAKETAKILNIEYCPLLTKRKNTASQVSLSKKDRQKNLDQSFTISQGLNIQLYQGKTIILIDDIITTGSTLQECAQTIQKHVIGSSIWGAVLARKA